MDRRLFLIGLLAFGLPDMARADTRLESILEELRREGYFNIRHMRTWLGRIRILADSSHGTREIVFNPSTGLVLRDYLFQTPTDNNDRKKRPPRPPRPGGRPPPPGEGGPPHKNDKSLP